MWSVWNRFKSFLLFVSHRSWKYPQLIFRFSIFPPEFFTFIGRSCTKIHYWIYTNRNDATHTFNPLSSSALTLQRPKLWREVCLSFIQEQETLAWSEADVTPTEVSGGPWGGRAGERWLKSKKNKTQKRVRDEPDGEAERWGWEEESLGSREDRVDGKSVRSHFSLSVSARLWSHGAALHLSASVIPLLSSSCAAQTLLSLKCFRGSNLQPPSVWIHIAEAGRPIRDDYKSSIWYASFNSCSWVWLPQI